MTTFRRSVPSSATLGSTLVEVLEEGSVELEKGCNDEEGVGEEWAKI